MEPPKCACSCECQNPILDRCKPCVLCQGGPFCDECWQAHLHECKSLDGELRADMAARLKRKLEKRREKKKQHKQRLIDYLRIKTDGKCFYCEEPTPWFTIDHYVPRSKGGDSSRNNLVPACYECNHRKGDMTGEEFKRHKCTHSDIG